MGWILNLETSTKVCSVNLARDGVTMAERDLFSENYSHAENLTVFIQDVIKMAEVSMDRIDAVAISAGPGSYTGLRIGCSTAKGLCFGLGIPLIAIDSLQALAAMVKANSDLICPMFDARRMEVYAALYNSNLDVVKAVQPIVLEEYRFEDYLDSQRILFLGPGAEKTEKVIQNPNATFDLDTMVSAKGMTMLSHKKFLDRNFVDTAYFEPLYLKEFIAGKPKQLL